MSIHVLGADQLAELHATAQSLQRPHKGASAVRESVRTALADAFKALHAAQVDAWNRHYNDTLTPSEFPIEFRTLEHGPLWMPPFRRDPALKRYIRNLRMAIYNAHDGDATTLPVDAFRTLWELAERPATDALARI